MTAKPKFKIYYPLFLLFIPLVAMQFTNQVIWGPLDFVIMGILLLLVGVGINLVLKRSQNKSRTILLISLITIVFLLIWVELAVGIFGSPFAGS